MPALRNIPNRGETGSHSLFERLRNISSISNRLKVGRAAESDDGRSEYNRRAGAGAGGGAKDGARDDGGEERFSAPAGELDSRFTRGNYPRQRNRPGARAQERTPRSVRRAADARRQANRSDGRRRASSRGARRSGRGCDREVDAAQRAEDRKAACADRRDRDDLRISAQRHGGCGRADAESRQRGGVAGRQRGAKQQRISFWIDFAGVEGRRAESRRGDLYPRSG